MAVSVTQASPRRLEIKQGSLVRHAGRDYTVIAVPDFEWVLVKELKTEKIDRVLIKELQSAIDQPSQVKTQDLISITDEDWLIAQERFNCIRPLLEGYEQRTRTMVIARAKETEKTTSTLYRWLKLYEASGMITSLLPLNRQDKGRKRLTPEVEQLIDRVIEQEYLTRQQKKITHVCREIDRLCHLSNLPKPHPNTIRNRIDQLSLEHKVARRQGGRVADAAFSPILGSFPNADWPLAVVQLDHTPVDIILVDDMDRRPIGRPWITMAIDVYSRMIGGFYISFDPPGALAAGQAIANIILPKEAWLARHNISGELPVWGKMDRLHMDNAREFRGKVLERACENHGITIEWRPVRRAYYGGHIESLLGTFAEEIHTLPGTTFSNTRERGDYDSDGKAIFSLSEFEGWLLEHIVGDYHQRLHSALNTSPLAKWREGILGSTTRMGRGMPPRELDELRLRLDFMPFVERTIQDYGVVLDGVHYYHEVLRHWINAVDPNQRKQKRLFTFRRDPRDISLIYFYDPELEQYFPIPYRDATRPAITLWELRAAMRQAREDGLKDINEDTIFQTRTRMIERVEAAKQKTRAVRRQEQRQRDGKQRSVVAQTGVLASKGVVTDPIVTKTLRPTPEPSTATSITPFDDLDFGTM